MLDIRAIREEPDAIRDRLRTRGGDHWELIDELLACDETRRRTETDKQALQSERKKASKAIGGRIAQGEDPEQAKAEVKAIGDKIAALDEEGSTATDRQQELLLNIPNLPHDACPKGEDETANPLIREWGQKPTIEAPKDHLALAEPFGLFSLEDGARIAGSGFAVYRGQGARLERALIQFLLDLQTGPNGYQEVNVPNLVRRECMEGTGQLPKFEDDMYGTAPGEDDTSSLFLAPWRPTPRASAARQARPAR